MKSVVFMFVNEDGEEMISVGNMAYYNSVAKTCRQLICCMTMEHTEEERYEMTGMEQEELGPYLQSMIFDNPEMLYFPS
jgi:hypothetical protein